MFLRHTAAGFILAFLASIFVISFLFAWIKQDILSMVIFGILSFVTFFAAIYQKYQARKHL